MGEERLVRPVVGVPEGEGGVGERPGHDDVVGDRVAPGPAAAELDRSTVDGEPGHRDHAGDRRRVRGGEDADARDAAPVGAADGRLLVRGDAVGRKRSQGDRVDRAVGTDDPEAEREGRGGLLDGRGHDADRGRLEVVRDPGAGEEQRRRRRGGQPVPGEGVDRDARPQRDAAEGVRDDTDGGRPALPARRDDGHRRDVLAIGVDRPNRLRHGLEIDGVQRSGRWRPRPPQRARPAQLRAPTARASAETTMMLRATVTTGTSQRVVPRRLDARRAAPAVGRPA